MLRKVAQKVGGVSKDTFSTVAGCIGGVLLGASMGALTAISQGQLTKEAVIAGAASGAVPVVAGWLHNKGNQAPVRPESTTDRPQ